MMIVGSEEIRNREVKGTYRKYTYYCNGNPCYVYLEAHTGSANFVNLIAKWNKQGKRGNYSYTFTDIQGEPIALEDIPKDNNFKVKTMCTVTGGITYIQ